MTARCRTTLAEMEAVGLKAAHVDLLRGAAAARVGAGAVLVGLFVVGAALIVGARIHPLAGIGLTLPAVAFVLGMVVARRRPLADAARAEGFRIKGPWVLVRAELEAAGREPPKILWSIRSPEARRLLEVPAVIGSRLDPDGARRLASRLADGSWPSPGRAPVAELRQDGTLVIGRRSRVVVDVELNGVRPDPPVTGPR